jgi:hypothetical protein
LRDGGHTFVELRALGIAPVAGMRDESFVNLGAPRFFYGHQRYSAIGLSSNGFLVVGGGSPPGSAYRPQTFPDPRQPNNVLAPLWTDLDPSAGGHVYVARVRRGERRWIVVEWRRVPVYHSTARQTFEVWIRAGSVEKIAYAYDHVAGPGAATGLTVGAENSDGTSGRNLDHRPVAGEEVTVVMGLPRPGETETIPYHVTGHAAGTYELVATMTSPAVEGVTVRKIRITVGP